jgi:hypothetical protein
MVYGRNTQEIVVAQYIRSKRAPGGCLRLLVARKDVASDETLWGPAGRG